MYIIYENGRFSQNCITSVEKWHMNDHSSALFDGSPKDKAEQGEEYITQGQLYPMC